MISVEVEFKYQGHPSWHQKEKELLVRNVLSSAQFKAIEALSINEVGTSLTLALAVRSNSPVEAEEILDDVLRLSGFRFEEDREVLGPWITAARGLSM